MSLNQLVDLEAKVKSLLAHLHEMKRRNVQLEDRLREANDRFSRQEAAIRRSDKEREWLKGKLRKVLGDLEAIEFSEPSIRD